MTGQELFERMARTNLVSRTWEWETATPDTHQLYDFIASLHRQSMSAEELYERVGKAGLLKQNLSFSQRSRRFQASYGVLAREVSDG